MTLTDQLKEDDEASRVSSIIKNVQFESDTVFFRIRLSVCYPSTSIVERSEEVAGFRMRKKLQKKTEPDWNQTTEISDHIMEIETATKRSRGAP